LSAWNILSKIYLFYFQNPVIFSYYQSKTETLKKGSIISFPQPLVNIGNSFDGTTFKCSTPGYYSFQFTGTGEGDRNQIQVLKNDAEVLEFWDDTASTAVTSNLDDNALMSFQFMLKLARDDTVNLKVTDDKIYTDNTRYRIFNGQFIRPL